MVLAVRPVKLALTLPLLKDALRLFGEAFTEAQPAKLDAVPQQNVTVVVAPPGFTVPLMVAVVSATEVALSVVEVGWARVRKLSMVPKTSLLPSPPTPLLPMIWK